MQSGDNKIIYTKMKMLIWLWRKFADAECRTLRYYNMLIADLAVVAAGGDGSEVAAAEPCC